MDIKNHVDYKTFASAAAVNNGATGDFPFFNVSKNSSTEEILSGLNSIENTLSKLSLKFRVYDIYNIQATVSNQDECDKKLNSLTNNTAAVINSDRQLITYIRGEQVLLTRGDVVYKDNAGELQHIKSNSGGWYKPNPELKIDEKGNQFVEFVYTSSATEDVSFNYDPIEVAQIYGLYGDDINVSVDGGVSKEETLKSFDNAGTNTTIYPLVKNYRPMETGKEEICLDGPFFTLSVAGGKFTLNYKNMGLSSISYVIK